MRIAFVLLLVAHGLIHLMGFLKAFDLAVFQGLNEAISRPVGAVWLIAALLFVMSGILVLLSLDWWWVAALLGLLVSQSLIVTYWGDAKFGTIANVIVLVPTVITLIGASPLGLRAAFRRDAASHLAESRVAATAIVTEADLMNLPPLVQAYLRFAGVVGKPRVASYRVAFTGDLRSEPGGAWMPSVATQQSWADPPTRLFLIESTLHGIPFAAFHRYEGASATMQVKVASLVRVVDAKGPEMDQSETVTLFNDMCLLAPATLLSPHIRWDALDARSVSATFTNAGHTISAVLFFDAAGALIDFISEDRYRTIDGAAYERRRWSTPVRDYRRLDGRQVPMHAEASWALPIGEFTYARFELLEIEYN